MVTEGDTVSVWGSFSEAEAEAFSQEMRSGQSPPAAFPEDIRLLLGVD